MTRHQGDLQARLGYCPLMPEVDLGQRVRGLAVVRFVVAVAIVVGSVAAVHVFGLTELNVGGLCVLAGVLLACNLVTFAVSHASFQESADVGSRQRALTRVLHFSVATDFILLTVVLWLVGGPFSPFKGFFIFNVIIASVLLSPNAAFMHAGLAYLLLAGLTIATWRGWLPGNYPAGAVVTDGVLSGQYVLVVLTVHGLLIMLTAMLTTYLMRVLRKSRRQLLATSERMEQMSQLRRDFLQLALHNLRAPVGAVSMHLSNLYNGLGGPLTELQQEWIDRSQLRLRELVQFLNDLEWLAALETGELTRHAEQVDLVEIVRELMRENQDLLEKSGLEWVLEAEKSPLNVVGIARLVREAIANYLTNAIKYTPRGGQIVVRLTGNDTHATVQVEDNGIGIPLREQHRLFHELIRLNPSHADLGLVDGSGLGLYIVQRIAELHGATVAVESREGKGSVFSILFPRDGLIVGVPELSYTDSEPYRGRDDA